MWGKPVAPDPALAEARERAAWEQGKSAVMTVELQRANERIDALLAQLAELRREGFDPPREYPDAPTGPDVPPAVERAIRRSAGRNANVADELRALALNWLGEDPDDETIAAVAQRIERGRDPAEFGL